jgi:serine/threonine-protein kinase
MKTEHPLAEECSVTRSKPSDEPKPELDADASLKLGDSDVESPLRLEDSSEGSTHPIPAEQSEPAASKTGSATAASTSGGFETLMGKLVVGAGLATQDEIDLCVSELDERGSGDDPLTMVDLLVEKQFMTRHQLDRLRQEFEAKKSGQHIPGYRILKKLGSGAMATVFLAKQMSLDRLVAIKILPKRFSNNDNFIERFYKEGRAAAQLNHPNIVGAYDVGRAGDHHYFVMEYVDGDTVYELIQKQKRVKEKPALEIVKQVAKALKHAHERGFIHRDIKPKNIMITKNRVVKLADLGLARGISDREAAKAEAGRAYGTPYYISPEQIRGEMEIGPAADIYGLGATLYHMITGRVPFEGKNPSAVMHKHLKNPLAPPDHVNPEISAGCAQIVEMMMAKKVADRYRNVDDLLEDIDLVVQGDSPHFAHRSLDHAAITDALTDVAKVPTQIPVPQLGAPAPSLTGNPLFMTVLVVMAVSVIANLVLLLLLLGS